MVKVYLKSYPTLIYYNGFSFNRIDFYFGLILQSRAKLAEQEARMSLLRGMASNRMTNEQKEESERIQVNLCQKLLFLHQLTHNMTTDCSLIYQSST